MVNPTDDGPHDTSHGRGHRTTHCRCPVPSAGAGLVCFRSWMELCKASSSSPRRRAGALRSSPSNTHGTTTGATSPPCTKPTSCESLRARARALDGPPLPSPASSPGPGVSVRCFCRHLHVKGLTGSVTGADLGAGIQVPEEAEKGAEDPGAPGAEASRFQESSGCGSAVAMCSGPRQPVLTK